MVGRTYFFLVVGGQQGCENVGSERDFFFTNAKKSFESLIILVAPDDCKNQINI